MRLTPLTSSLALLALLVGCSSADKPDAPDQPPASGDGRCNADTVQGILGQTANSDLVEQTRQRSGAQFARVLAPGDAVTMDYNSLRLNIEIDESEVVTRVTCG